MAYIYTDAYGNILTDKTGVILASTANIVVDIPKTAINYKPYIYINGKFVQVKQLMYTNDEIKKHKVFIYKYRNQVPYSIDTNNNIYNNTGYIEGYRLSSSGELKEQDSTVTTGYISATKDSIIRMSGTSWIPGGYNYNYITFYDKNFNLLATVNNYGAGSSNGVSNVSTAVNKEQSSIITDNAGITIFNIVFNSDIDYQYIRISAKGLGNNMIVTINEEIT